MKTLVYIVVNRNGVLQSRRMFKSMDSVMRHINKNQFRKTELFYRQVNV